jgi:A/G-specific adenine glycosylase
LLDPVLNRPSLRRRLLAWFRTHQRDLPWRHNRDPYRIWISEVLLQQTQVATAVPGFHRFLAAFPTLADLAAADVQEVLRQWEGLGYYRRARDLHRAARQIVAEHGGTFPDDPAAAAQLPGLGRYMVGAILSQAFNRPMPIVEANSKRVLCRLFAHDGDIRSRATERWLWETAGSILSPRNPGEFNQALMELGALVCTPKSPRCSECPLAGHCRAYRHGLQGQIPRAAPAPRIVPVEEVAVVVRRRRDVLLVQRPPAGRWAGMWEFPHAPRASDEPLSAAAVRIGRSFLGIGIGNTEELMTIRHNVTRFRITMHCMKSMYLRGRFQSIFYPRGEWLDPGDLHRYPVSRPQRILADRVASDFASGAVD